MAEVWARLLSAGTKNVHVQVSGWVLEEVLDWKAIVKASDFNSTSLRLDSINYALSDKTEVLLAWDKEKEGEEPHVFLPLNGRGRLDFDAVNGLQNTVGEGKNGDVLIYVSTELTRKAYFTLTLDFSKQGN